MKKEKETGFSGFLDGYKASNIASSSSSVEYIFREMKHAIEDILISQRSKNAPDQLISYLTQLSSVLSESHANVFQRAVSCGEILKTILLISKQYGDPSALLSEEKMKLLVYHYLDFAEISEDKTVRDLAISIGEMF